MNKFIFVSIIAIIIIFGTSLTINAEPSAKIIQHRGYIDTSDIYHVVGEVKNTGDQPLGYVTVSVVFYNEEGDVVATDEVLTRIHVLLPGRIVPFDATTFVTEVHNYELSAVAQVVKAKPQSLRLNSNISYTDNLGLYHVVGKINNDSNKQSTFTNVVATFYDENGVIVATERDLTEPINIPSGESGEFKITIHRDLASKVASYSIDAESDEFLMMERL